MPTKDNKTRWGESRKDAARSAIKGLTSHETVYAKRSREKAFKSFCKSRKYKINRHTSIAKLAEILEDYAFNMRRQDGTDYKEGVIKSHWNTIAKYLRDLFFEKYGTEFDPYHDIQFSRARVARDSKRKILKTDPSKHAVGSAVLSLKDYTKMIQAYDPETPDGLMRRVFLILCKDLAWRGKEALRALVEYFVDDVDSKGTPTGILIYNPVFSKTHPGGNKPLAVDKWLIPNDDDHSMCPVRLYKKMLSLRPADAPNRVFLNRNLNWRRSSKCNWYTKLPVGKDSLGKWLKQAAEKIGLKGEFTNHSARYTAVTHLANARIPLPLAMRITGHRSVQSLQRYVRMQKEDVKEIMLQLRSGVKNTTNPCVVKSVPRTSRGNMIIRSSDENGDERVE